MHFKKHLIHNGASIREALERLNVLAADAILFVIDDLGRLIGSLTDGDVRRGLIRGLNTDNKVGDFIQPNPKFIDKTKYDLNEIISLRENNFKIIPVVDENKVIINIVNFRLMKSYLPVDAIIMAGGRGVRLKPLTDSVPKPLLKVGGKPIIEHNIERLSSFGIDDFILSVRYLGEQIEQFFGNGINRNITIDYVREDEPMGTIGSISKIDKFNHDHILISNSDILTDLDYEDFYLDFIKKGADMSVATVPYAVDVPYAVMETSNHHVISFKEKPTYTYYSNGGIYLVKRSVLKKIPKNSFYNATDLMHSLLRNGDTLISYPIRQYWLDIGKHEDYAKAQEDILHLKL